MRKTEAHKQCSTAFPKAISFFKDFLWRLATSSFLVSLKDIVQNTAEGSRANQKLSLTKTNRKEDNFPDNLVQTWSLFIMLKYLLLFINFTGSLGKAGRLRGSDSSSLPPSCQWMFLVQLWGQWLPSPAVAVGSALWKQGMSEASFRPWAAFWTPCHPFEVADGNPAP